MARHFVLSGCLLGAVLLSSLLEQSGAVGRYTPDWNSLDTRPAPAWYDEVKIGVFIHWGVFAVPSFAAPSGGASEWFWMDWQSSKEVKAFMAQNYRPGFTYADFAPQFTAEFYNPDDWADLFKKAGIQYVVLTSKHHEGFTMWPSNVSWNWNAGDVGPKRDLLGDLAKSIRNRTDIHFGVYHSLFEWFNPLYVADRAANFTTQNFVARKTMPELMELVNTYKPDVIWSDGDWEAKPEYWNSTEFLAWLYNDSPVKDSVLVNDRWGIGVQCAHGDFYNCKDRYSPGVLMKHKWENAMTLDAGSWGYRRQMKTEDVLTVEQLLYQVVSTVSCNGNILINIGPTKEGTIAPIFQERLLQLGQWLDVNGEAIYGTRPWTSQNDTLNGNTWYTSKKNTIYATMLKWPEDSILTLGDVGKSMNSNYRVTMLGYAKELTWDSNGQQVVIRLPDLSPKDAQKLQWAWTLKFEQ